jgi:hypothetical protein
MTFTDCWIETVDDEDYSAYIAEQARLGVRRALRLDLLPRLPAAQHYWIPVLQEWAAARGLPVDYVDPLWIRVPVTRAQLMDFLDTIYGKLGDDSLARLRTYFAGRSRDDKTYLLVADEF